MVSLMMAVVGIHNRCMLRGTLFLNKMVHQNLSRGRRKCVSADP